MSTRVRSRAARQLTPVSTLIATATLAALCTAALFPRLPAGRDRSLSRGTRQPDSSSTKKLLAAPVRSASPELKVAAQRTAEGGGVTSRRSGWRRVLSTASTLLTVGVLAFWFFALRPISLGGTANYTVIHGNSMWPLYHDGDLIITHQQSTYGVGDVVAYHVPQGEVGAGDVVIHRIVGGSATTGLNLLGDNNPNVDPWHPKMANVVGSSWLQIGRAGRLLVLLHQPLALAIVAAVPAMVMLLRRKPRKPEAGAAAPMAAQGA